MLVRGAGKAFLAGSDFSLVEGSATSEILNSIKLGLDGGFFG